MTSPMTDTIEKDLKGIVGGKLLVDMHSFVLLQWLKDVRMIDRVEAIRLISRYNGHVTSFDEPQRYKLDVPSDLQTFNEQVGWIVEKTLIAENNPRHWQLPERIEGGIRLFVYDFTYIEIVDIEGSNERFGARILSITGGAEKIKSMANLLAAVVAQRSWLDDPDLNRMIRGFGA